jgi:hypothetical protein
MFRVSREKAQKSAAVFADGHQAPPYRMNRKGTKAQRKNEAARQHRPTA